MNENGDNTNPLAERTGEWTPEFEDRRRIAVSEVLLCADRNGGGVWPMQFGQAVLHQTTDESEVVALADATQIRLAKLVARGY